MHKHKDRGHHRRVRTILLLFVLMLSGAPSFAHPMGNFSINHYSRVTIKQDSVEVLYLIDMAEIPTFQETRQFDISRAVGDPRDSRYLDKQEQLLKEGLSLLSDGKPVRLDTQSRQMTFADGAGGLPTMKLGFVFGGKLESAAGSHKLSYSDNNFPGRSGWKEIVVLGDGVVIVDSSAPNTDRSHELTDYSSDALNSPPQQVSAVADFKTSLKEAASDASTQTSSRDTVSQAGDLAVPASGSLHLRRGSRPTLLAVHPAANAGAANSVASTSSQLTNAHSAPGFVATSGALPVSARAHAQNTPRSRFTELISTQEKLCLWLLLSAAFIAAGLGALHALEPGHGKTIVAAYLVGSRGTARHAVLLGIVVTAAHTAGVFLLGAVTLYASRYIVPEQLYPWLGVISGLSVAGLGIFIFLRRWTGETGEHSHAPGDRHSHWFLSMFKQATPLEAANGDVSRGGPTPTERALSLRELCMLGITGGIVPCPAALVVLLSAFSLHRIGFGMFLITAFSFGLAAVLVIVGLGMVYTKRFMSTRLSSGSRALRYLPLLSSAFMLVLGLAITVSAVGSMHLGPDILSRNKLVPFATVVLLGLFLGMRHSTDADHVVAVSTIVSRQGSVRSSATIGLLWGLGHTLTIFFVGSAIIIFGVVIPPRLGLSMEFCVALMLILLGVLNLTGMMSWVTDRLTPARRSVAASSQLDFSRHTEPTGRKNAQVFSRVQFLSNKTVGRIGLYQTMRPLVVGLVHGLAGSAAVALLMLSTIKSPLWSTAYLLVFGFGTMVGMMLMTAAISVPLIYAGNRFFKMTQHLTFLSGLASVAFGMFLVYQIGFVHGLFTAHVNWIPQ